MIQQLQGSDTIWNCFSGLLYQAARLESWTWAKHLPFQERKRAFSQKSLKAHLFIKCFKYPDPQQSHTSPSVLSLPSTLLWFGFAHVSVRESHFCSAVCALGLQSSYFLGQLSIDQSQHIFNCTSLSASSDRKTKTRGRTEPIFKTTTVFSSPQVGWLSCAAPWRHLAAFKELLKYLSWHKRTWMF